MGLEGALIDRERRTIAALDPDDERTVELWIAGPGALLVAKVHKIAERVGSQDRVRDKDALDVLRLLRSIETEQLSDRLSVLRRNDLSSAVTAEAVCLLPDLFGTAESAGVAMAVRAAGPGDDPATIPGSVIALVEDLCARLGPST